MIPVRLHFQVFKDFQISHLIANTVASIHWMSHCASSLSALLTSFPHPLIQITPLLLVCYSHCTALYLSGVMFQLFSQLIILAAFRMSMSTDRGRK